MTDGWHHSSHIMAVAYDPKTQLMTIRFKSGGVYHHYGVSPREFEAFDQAHSPGKHYAEHFRGKFGAKPHRG